MTADELYEATSGRWVIVPRRDDVELALAAMRVSLAEQEQFDDRATARAGVPEAADWTASVAREVSGAASFPVTTNVPA